MRISKIVRRILIYLVLSVAVGLLGYFLFRNIVANYLLNKKIAFYEKKWNADITVNNVRFEGLRTIVIRQLDIIPSNSDTLLHIGEAEIRISLPNLLQFRARISNLMIDNIHLKLVKTPDKSTNYLFIINELAGDVNKNQMNAVPADVNYRKKILNIFSQLFGYIPKEVWIKRCYAEACLMGENFSLAIPDLHIYYSRFVSDFYLKQQLGKSTIRVEGQIKRSEKCIDLLIYPLDTVPVSVPYLQHRWKTRIAFDTLAFRLDSLIEKGNDLIIKGFSKISRFTVENQRISDKPVFVERGIINFIFRAGKSYLELDSVGSVILNKINFSPFIRWDVNPDRILTIKIAKPYFDANLLFQSLPKGLFQNLEGIAVQGQFAFKLDFKVNIDKPYDIMMDGGLFSRDFSILQYGKANLAYISEPFDYTVYENGDSVKTIHLWFDNAHFLTLDKISPVLTGAILTSEDGTFYMHKGFFAEGIKNAISTNIERGKFARGGSTITMQLVKNIFLSRHKTITRKAEEALITWLIENANLCSKDRMLEIYLNIVEMGPYVYGVGEGSWFYFEKTPDKISLPEALFMASVIPRPKKFYYLVDSSGYVKPQLESYYNFISEKMLQRGMITQSDFDSLTTHVRIGGEALKYLKYRDQPITDTIEVYEPDSL